MYLDFDPLAHKESYAYFKNIKVKKDFFGEAPAPFIGRYGYPEVNVGILAPQDIKNTAEYDAPKEWARKNLQIPTIINYRSALVNSRFKAHIKVGRNRFLEIAKEVGMASKPVEVEINLQKIPSVRMFSDNYAAPTGPAGVLEKAKITANSKISKKVEYIVNDIDLKAAEGLTTLYNKGFDENFLSRLLSVGNLGLEKNRKLVPTRWSITATDTTLGNNLLQKVKDAPELDTYQAYFDGYLGNYFLILFMPDSWQYELFETMMPSNPPKLLRYTTDYEPFQGRKKYAEETAGGFYATRLAVLERLTKLKRQASVLVLRYITTEYHAPLGVWVVREAVRRSLSSNPLTFSSKELLLQYAEQFVKKKFGWDTQPLISASLLLKNYKKQTKLSSFFNN